MSEYTEEQWQLLLNASPAQFLGFSGADRTCLNHALDRLPEDEQRLLINVMENGGLLKAAKNFSGTKVATAISTALVALRQKFGIVLEELYPH